MVHEAGWRAARDDLAEDAAHEGSGTVWPFK
jgi:hypothetical protein